MNTNGTPGKGIDIISFIREDTTVCRFPVIVSVLYKSSGGSASDASMMMEFSTGGILFADKILVTNKVTTGQELVSTCICG